MTVTIDALTRADVARCAELEKQLFDGDDPWPAWAFLHEMSSRHNHYVAARAGDKLVGYAGIARLGRLPPHEYEVHTIGVDPAGSAMTLPFGVKTYTSAALRSYRRDSRNSSGS